MFLTAYPDVGEIIRGSGGILYGKGVKDDLTPAERAAWRKVVEEINNAGYLRAAGITVSCSDLDRTRSNAGMAWRNVSDRDILQPTATETTDDHERRQPC